MLLARSSGDHKQRLHTSRALRTSALGTEDHQGLQLQLPENHRCSGGRLPWCSIHPRLKVSDESSGMTPHLDANCIDPEKVLDLLPKGILDRDVVRPLVGSLEARLDVVHNLIPLC